VTGARPARLVISARARHEEVLDNSAISAATLRAVATVEHLDFMRPPWALYEVATNKNRMTGTPIEGQATSELQPWARATSGTSPTMRKIGEMERGLPTSMQVSPQVLQTLFHGYLNNWADTGLVLTDWAVAKMQAGPPQADRRLDQMPLVRRFLEQEPRPTRRYVTSYFDVAARATEARQTFKEMDRSGRSALGDEVLRSPANIERDQLVRADKTMTGIRHDIDAVTEAPDIGGDAQTGDRARQGDARSELVARLQWTGAWNDVGALKRAPLDSLTTERNQFAKGVMADIDKQRTAEAARHPGPAAAP